MHFSILTLFPEIFPGPLQASILGKAKEKEQWSLEVYSLRNFATDKHLTVDDKPFGGGVGMVMRPDVLARALDHVIDHAKIPPDLFLYPSPRGTPLTQSQVRHCSEYTHILILCGRYEGIDQRLLEAYPFQEFSLGDYVLAGGEIPALAFMEATLRYVPGVLGKTESLSEESFGENNDYSGLLEYPHYTRPAIWRERSVPEVLLSGNHQAIKQWRLEQSKLLTEQRRPDLWKNYLKGS